LHSLSLNTALVADFWCFIKKTAERVSTESRVVAKILVHHAKFEAENHSLWGNSEANIF